MKSLTLVALAAAVAALSADCLAGAAKAKPPARKGGRLERIC